MIGRTDRGDSPRELEHDYLALAGKLGVRLDSLTVEGLGLLAYALADELARRASVQRSAWLNMRVAARTVIRIAREGEA